MPITHGAKLAKNTPTCARRSCLRSTAFPRSSIPCTWNTFFAKSIPTVVIFMLDAPIHLSGNQHFHFGTLMPFRVGAPIPLVSSSVNRSMNVASTTGRPTSQPRSSPALTSPQIKPMLFYYSFWLHERRDVKLADFERWRLTLEDDGRESAATTRRIRKLERKLVRKEKALAEAAALLVLKKERASTVCAP